MRYSIGSTENNGHSTYKKSIMWFVESRSWSKVLSTTGTGYVARGSKTSLITALHNGSSLRLLVHETTDSYNIIKADNIAIENSEVAAEVMRYISDENGSAEIIRRFKSPAYWQSTLTSTDENKRAAWWNVGEHTSLPTTIGNYQVH